MVNSQASNLKTISFGAKKEVYRLSRLLFSNGLSKAH